jgi:hypothetical protein
MNRPQRWRDEFLSVMGREGVSVDVARKFMRVAATMQRLAEAQCNGDYPADNGNPGSKLCAECDALWHPPGLRKDGLCISCHADRKAVAMVAEFLPGWKCELQGDPRGCVLKLKTPQGREIGVP